MGHGCRPPPRLVPPSFPGPALCSTLTEFVPVDQPVPQSGLLPIYYHGSAQNWPCPVPPSSTPTLAPDLAGSSAVVNPTDQMLALPPGQALPQIGPSAGALAGGPPEAVGAPIYLPDSTPSLSGPAAAPSVTTFSQPGTTQSSPSLPPVPAASSLTPHSPLTVAPPVSAAPVTLTPGCWLLAAGLEHIDQVLTHPVGGLPETVGAPIPPTGATHNAPAPPAPDPSPSLSPGQVPVGP